MRERERVGRERGEREGGEERGVGAPDACGCAAERVTGGGGCRMQVLVHSLQIKMIPIVGIMCWMLVIAPPLSLMRFSSRLSRTHQLDACVGACASCVELHSCASLGMRARRMRVAHQRVHVLHFTYEMRRQHDA